MRRPLWTGLITVLVLGCTVTACEKSNGADEKATSEKGQALKLVIPPHASTPRVDLVYRVHPLEEGEIESVKEPIGNAVYMALKACEQAYPPKEAASIVPLKFDIEGGKAANVSKREPEVRDDAEPVGEDAQKCVVEELEGSEVGFSADSGFSERSLRVDAQAKLHWKSL